MRIGSHLPQWQTSPPPPVCQSVCQGLIWHPANSIFIEHCTPQSLFPPLQTTQHHRSCLANPSLSSAPRLHPSFLRSFSRSFLPQHFDTCLDLQIRTCAFSSKPRFDLDNSTSSQRTILCDKAFDSIHAGRRHCYRGYPWNGHLDFVPVNLFTPPSTKLNPSGRATLRPQPLVGMDTFSR